MVSLTNNILPGNVYYFNNPYLIQTHEPHYHVVISILNGSIILFGVLTTQFENRKFIFKENNYDPSTLVRIKKTKYNSLTYSESFVDCNYPCRWGFIDFTQLLSNRQVNINGIISEDEFEQLKIGIDKSDLIEGETKEIIRRTTFQVI